ncbi:MAG: DEAD/DEAH box helicase [Methylovulum sp.]|nr:DEAD/DEAH box helicase [Methylovulum sp.]
MISLRPYQEDAITALLNWFSRNPTGNPIINACVGAGKSIIIAELCRRIISQWPNQRILMVVASRELVKQNYDKLKSIYPEANAGLYSASLGRKDPHAKIVFATIGSIHNKAMHTGAFNLCLVDECHNINRKKTGIYRAMIAEYTRLNPRFRVVGLTGTPFRGDGVLLTEGDQALFTDIAVTISIKDMIEQNYLAPLVLSETITKTDISGVQINKATGDYNIVQLAKAIDREEITRSAVSEIINAGRDRKAWLIFGVDVKHCQHIYEELKAQGVAAGIVHGKTPTAERDRTFINYKAGRLKALVNCLVATTGFDYPSIDLIALIRNTKSPVLYIQIAGRGLRTAQGKQNCLWLDFTDTTSTLGCIDQIKGRKEPKKQDKAEIPSKQCPQCQAIYHLSEAYCVCGHEFMIAENALTINHQASAAPILSDGLVCLFEVSRMGFRVHSKSGSPDSLCILYYPPDFRAAAIKEWLCFDHQGYARRKAEMGWLKLGGTLPYPDNVQEALLRSKELRKPDYLSISKTGKFNEVKSHVYAANQATHDNRHRELFSNPAQHATGNALQAM